MFHDGGRGITFLEKEKLHNDFYTSLSQLNSTSNINLINLKEIIFTILQTHIITTLHKRHM